MSSRQAGHEPGPVESAMRDKLNKSFNPSLLEIQNDSSKHSHHAPMKAIGGGSGETHFSLTLVSPQFDGLTSIKRHRMVNNLLKDEFDAGLHALSLKLKTPEEWDKEAGSRR
ncbi:bola-like protein-domain-containing protein [Kockovaella imperatae]|uniref:Bola-like protein-domain-containing protein n=1 Tax=Kockovaella imperatae TaxID=4999 RepID=A0A1Y1U956_9TREE|nr:bola-like protein-domain-containing protein [Kockovaella imperatae]ORX34037.1 bola-like protein-domain-containing protein [Kockovaella imperatae]